jgi:hypothetical protein
VPERIRESRAPYIQALRAADRAWEAGKLDVSELDAYLAGLLQAQLAEVPSDGSGVDQLLKSAATARSLTRWW